MTEDAPFTSTIDLDANDTDLDGDALSVVPGTFVTAAGGSISIIADGSYTYTPAANFNGADSVDYTVTDGALTDIGTLNITVTSGNDAPVAVDDSITAIEDTPFTSTIDLDANDTDLDGDALSVIPGTFATTAGGTITIVADGSYTYTPAANFNGADSVDYTVTDGALTDIGTLNITVTAVNDAPVFDSTAVTAATEDVAYSYTVTASDVDVEAVTITAPTLPAWLTLVDNGDGTATLSGTPSNAEVGSHSVVLNVSDGALSSAQSFTIVVGNTNDPAVIAGTDTGAVTEDAAVVSNNISTGGTLTISDPDAGESTFRPETLTGSYGVLIIDASGNWTYTADNTQAAIQQLNALESITDTLTVSSFDGTTHDVEITIYGAEDAPTLDNPIADQTATESLAFNFVFAANSFSDQDASDTLTYTASLIDNSPLPTWLSFDGATRTFLGIPGAADVGSIDIKITADDGSSTIDDVFTLTVNPFNNLPVIGGVDTGLVVEDQVDSAGNIGTSGALTIADPDAGESSFVASTINGALGSLTIDVSGNWSYSADNGNRDIQALQAGETITETFTVTTADGSTHDIEIVINGAQEPAPPPVVEPPPLVEPPPKEEVPPAEEEPWDEYIGVGDSVLGDDIVRIAQGPQSPIQDGASAPIIAEDDETIADDVDFGPAQPVREAQDPETRPAPPLQPQGFELNTLSFQVSDDIELNDHFEKLLLDRIDSMHEGMDGEAERQNADDTDVKIVIGSTLSLTAGIVGWVLRGGSLLASLMGAAPLLNRFDPLPILKSRADEEDVEPDDENDNTQTQTKTNVRRVEEMFSGRDDAR